MPSSMAPLKEVQWHKKTRKRTKTRFDGSSATALCLETRRRTTTLNPAIARLTPEIGSWPGPLFTEAPIISWRALLLSLCNFTGNLFVLRKMFLGTSIVGRRPVQNWQFKGSRARTWACKLQEQCHCRCSFYNWKISFFIVSWPPMTAGQRKTEVLKLATPVKLELYETGLVQFSGCWRAAATWFAQPRFGEFLCAFSPKKAKRWVH